jgi:hypothetical protein
VVVCGILLVVAGFFIPEASPARDGQNQEAAPVQGQGDGKPRS